MLLWLALVAGCLSLTLQWVQSLEFACHSSLAYAPPSRSPTDPEQINGLNQTEFTVSTEPVLVRESFPLNLKDGIWQGKPTYN
jgi:hypothetical protein